MKQEMVSIKKIYVTLGLMLILLLGLFAIITSVLMGNMGSKNTSGSDMEVLAAAEGYMLYYKDIAPYIDDYKKGLVTAKVKNYVITREVADLGVEIDEEAVDNEFDNVKLQYTDEEFDKILKEKGMVADDLRDMIRESFCEDKLRDYYIKEMFEASDTELLSHYSSNKDMFDFVTARHILLESKEDALIVLGKLKDGKEFAELATEYSKDDYSAEIGGDLGEVHRGWMIPEFEEALFELAVGEVVAEPVETDFGFHVIECTGVYDTFEDVKTAVKEDYVNSKAYTAYEDYVGSLIGKYGVEIKE